MELNHNTSVQDDQVSWTTDQLVRLAEYCVAALDSGSPQEVVYPVLQWIAPQLPPENQSINPFDFENCEGCNQAVREFIVILKLLKYPYRFVLENSKLAWYLLSPISDSKYHEAIKMVLASPTPSHVMLLFRAAYRYSTSIIPDKDYDSLEDIYVEAFPELAYLKTQTYDDDAVPYLVRDALSSCMSKKNTSVKRLVLGESMSADMSDMVSEKTKSIQPLEDYAVFFQAVKDAGCCSIDFSLKVDGVNTQTKLSDTGEIADLIAVSRGRSGDSFDYSEAIRNCFSARGMTLPKESVKIIGEGVLLTDGMQALCDKYPERDYKSPKFAAGAMLRAPQNFEPADYKHLSIMTFSYKGAMGPESLKTLESLGFDTPAHIYVGAGDYPTGSLEEFSAWLDSNILDKLWETASEQQLTTDGVVAFFDNGKPDISDGKYTSQAVAIKFSHWAAMPYVSKVVGIEVEQRRVKMSLVLLIEPVTTRDFNTATRVGVGSPAICVNDGIKIGSVIEFVRKSEAYNTYLRVVSQPD